MKPPIGTVTFLFTDIEGSTTLWERHESEMRDALKIHNGILDQAIVRHGGFRFGNPGDGYCVAFDRAELALQAAVEAQKRISETSWPDSAPIRVRMGIHTGSGEYRYSNYLGRDVNRSQRVMETGQGGRIVLSGTTAQLVKGKLPPNCALEAHGRHLLRDLLEPDDLYTIHIAGMPTNTQPLRTLSVMHHNLPHMLTSFIDRRTELRQLEALLRTKRLVTVVGSGGAGKTRIALQAAANSVHVYSAGVLFVDLSGLTKCDLVGETTLALLGGTSPSYESAAERIVEILRNEDRLILLDNCEQVLDGVRSLADVLIKADIRSTILATSRIPIGLRGEQLLKIDGLRFAGEPITLGAMEECPAVRLFVERARDVLPDFNPIATELKVIRQICAELDGIPLAIELATTRLGVLTPSQLYSRLARRMELLRDPCGKNPGRHRTLEATIDWSCSLMSETERRMLLALSVFPSSWTADAVEAIFSDFEDPLAVLESLVRQSMVQFRQNDGRFRLLGSVRNYAEANWLDQEDRTLRLDSHRAYYSKLASQSLKYMHTDQEQEWLSQIDQEVDNLRAAMSTGGNRSRLETAVQMHRYWWVYGRLLEAESVLNPLLSGMSNDRSLLVADAYNALGHIHYARKKIDSAKTAYQAAQSIYLELDETAKVAATTNNLGNVFLDQARFHDARAAYIEAAQVFKSMGDIERQCVAKLNAAAAAIEQNEFIEAEAECEELMTQIDHVNQVSVAAASLNLVEVALRKGEPEVARSRLITALNLVRSTPSTHIELQLETRAIRYAVLCRDLIAAARWLKFTERRVQEVSGLSIESFDSTIESTRSDINCQMINISELPVIKTTEHFYAELNQFLQTSSAHASLRT